MDWKEVGTLIAPLAPVAGSILGGFLPIPGGSVIGQKFGELIAGAFGVAPTPQAVSDAIAKSNNDVVIANINAALSQARAQIDGFVEYEKAVQATIQKSIEQVNQTMRVEVLPENRHPFYTGWRPMAGWILDWYMGCFGILLLWATIVTLRSSPDPLKAMSDAWPIYGSYIGALGLIVGVAIIGRSQEKVALTNAAPPVVTTTTTKVIPKK